MATPLPKLKMAILALININDAFQMNLCWPFIPAFVLQFYDEKDLGIYVGLLAAAFHVGQFLSNKVWLLIANKCGRRPTLLLGLACSGASMAVFGYGYNFLVSLVARFASGFLNGNLTITKSYLAETTDRSNQSRGLSVLVLSWGFGSIAAPLLGGYLSAPWQSFSYFDQTFWHDHPFFLPCAIVCSLSFLGALLGLLLLPESEVWRSQSMSSQRSSVPAGKFVSALEKQQEQQAASSGAYSRMEDGDTRASASSALSKESSQSQLNSQRSSRLLKPSNSQSQLERGSSAYGSLAAEQDGNTNTNTNTGVSTAPSSASAFNRANRPLSKGASNISLGSNDSDSGLHGLTRDRGMSEQESSAVSQPKRAAKHPLLDQPSFLPSLAEADREESGDSGDGSRDFGAGHRNSRGGNAYSAHARSDSVMSDDSSNADSATLEAPLLHDPSGSVKKPTSYSHLSDRDGGGGGGSGADNSDDSFERRNCCMRLCDPCVDCCYLCVPHSIRDRQVFMSTSLLGLCALAFVMHDEILPLFCHTSYDNGGLEFEPKHIGILLAVQGLALLIFQFLLYRPMVSRLGPIRAFVIAAIAALLYFFFLPITSYLYDVVSNAGLWVVLVAVISVKACLAATAFTSVMLLVNNSARPENRAAVNGWGQTVSSFCRAVGPVGAGLLWSLSVDVDVKAFKFHVFFAYALMAFVMLVATGLALRVPRSLNRPQYQGSAASRNHQQA